MKKLAFIVSKMLQIFLPCYYGSNVHKASQGISSSLFHSKWIDKDKKYKIALKLFLENSKKATRISACKGLFAVEFGTFTRICNSAYSLFALFNKINLKWFNFLINLNVKYIILQLCIVWFDLICDKKLQIDQSQKRTITVFVELLFL